MRIHSWGQSSGVSYAQGISASCAVPPVDSDAEQGGAGALQVAFSRPTELIQKLGVLQESDPAAFKQVTNKVAQHFEDLASTATGPESRALVQLARRFASAAQSGDLSGLKPAGGAQPPGSQGSAGAVDAAPPPPAAAPLDAAGMAASFVESLTSATAGDGNSSPLQRLVALKTSDAPAFKKVMNQVAQQLEQFASFAEGSERESLQSLAVTFASSAQSRNLSALGDLWPAPVAPAPTPPAPPPPPAPKPPVDAAAAAASLVDSLTSGAAGGSSDPLERLTALKTSDVAGFKNVMNQIAQQLEQLASFEEGSDRENLQNLAVTFASSGQSRDLSALGDLWPAAAAPAPTPPAPPPPPPPKPPVDAVAVASSLVDSLTSATGDSTSDPLQRLSALKTSDVVGFKKLMNEVAQQLEQLASFEEGSDRESLQSLAVTFASSAQSRDLSALEVLRPAPTAPAPTPPAAPSAPPPVPPVDARATALSFVDALAPAAAGDTTSTPLQRLSALKTSNPASFKGVMNQVAQQLEQLATLSEGSDRDNLQSLAVSFASGAETGDLSALQPPASSEPAPAEPPPPAAPEPPPPPGWRYAQAKAAYLGHGPSKQAMDEAFSSALALVDSLTSPAAA